MPCRNLYLYAVPLDAFALQHWRAIDSKTEQKRERSEEEERSCDGSVWAVAQPRTALRPADYPRTALEGAARGREGVGGVVAARRR